MTLNDRQERFWNGFEAYLNANTDGSLAIESTRRKHAVYFQGEGTKPLGAGVRVSAITDSNEESFSIGLFLENDRRAEIFDELKADQHSLERALCCRLDFRDPHDAKRHRIQTDQYRLDLDDSSHWQGQFQWFVQTAHKFIDVFQLKTPPRKAAL